MATSFVPATWPVPIPAATLTGNLVQLETLTPAHLDELVAAGADPRLWEYTTTRADTREGMKAYVDKMLDDWQRGAAMPFVVRQRSTQTVVGSTRLKELDRNHRHGIVGSWYAPSAWRTGVNLEAKLLLLDYAFHSLECVRIEFHADARNQRSRRSLDQLGATLEGIMRAHQITRDGALRDSALYSILQSEWRGLREPLVARLKLHLPGATA